MGFSEVVPVVGVVPMETSERAAALAKVRRDQSGFRLGDELLGVRVRLLDQVEPFDARRCQQGVGVHDVRVGLVVTRTTSSSNGDSLLRRGDGLAPLPEAELRSRQVHQDAPLQI